MAEPGLIRQVLQAVPQQAPFRFIDEIAELDADHIVGSYRFRPDEFFYKGHFPGRPITIIVPFSAGGGTDLGARLLAADLEKELGQSVVVANREGAGSQGVGRRTEGWDFHHLESGWHRQRAFHSDRKQAAGGYPRSGARGDEGRRPRRQDRAAIGDAAGPFL